MELREVVLVDGLRSPFARGARGRLAATRLDDAGAHLLRALLDRQPRLPDAALEDVGLGNVGGGEFVRPGTVARLAGLPLEVCGFTSNRQCGSSMETFQRLALGIMAGQLDCGVALGIERMGRSTRRAEGGSRLTRPNPRLEETNEAQRRPAPDHFEHFSRPFPDWVLRSSPYATMPQTGQNVAEVWEIAREELDAFAVESHRKAHAAWEAGVYADEVLPLEVEAPVFDEKGALVEEAKGSLELFERDEGIRPGTTLEKLAALPPLPGVVSHGGGEVVTTAGNSCPTNDGISAAVLASAEKARALRLEPLARVLSFAVAGVKPQLMGVGPVVSTRRALDRAGLSPEQVDRVEFNEAFAAQVIASLRELGIPRERVNVNGGSLALGHPLGATGARLVVTVARELRRSGLRYGLATQCIGAGMGISTLLENPDGRSHAGSARAAA